MEKKRTEWRFQWETIELNGKSLLLRLINVKPCLVARHTIVTKIVQIILNPCNVWKVHYCGKNSWQTIFFVQENVSVKKLLTVFSGKKTCLSPCPKKIRSPFKPFLKNSFSTNVQGTGPWEGPVHFSRFVLRVHICSELFQSWSWSQEKNGRPFTKATFLFSVSLSFPFPLSFSFSLPFSLSLSSSLKLGAKKRFPRKIRPRI